MSGQKKAITKLPVRNAILVNAECPGKAEVGKLENTLLGNQNICRLHITVDDFVTMDIEEAFEHLLHNLFYLPCNENRTL